MLFKYSRYNAFVSLSLVYFCYEMPFAIFLLLLPSLVYLPLLTCTHLYSLVQVSTSDILSILLESTIIYNYAYCVSVLSYYVYCAAQGIYTRFHC